MTIIQMFIIGLYIDITNPVNANLAIDEASNVFPIATTLEAQTDKH